MPSDKNVFLGPEARDKPIRRPRVGPEMGRAQSQAYPPTPFGARGVELSRSQMFSRAPMSGHPVPLYLDHRENLRTATEQTQKHRGGGGTHALISGSKNTFSTKNIKTAPNKPKQAKTALVALFLTRHKLLSVRTPTGLARSVRSPCKVVQGRAESYPRKKKVTKLNPIWSLLFSRWAPEEGGRRFVAGALG